MHVHARAVRGGRRGVFTTEKRHAVVVSDDRLHKEDI